MTTKREVRAQVTRLAKQEYPELPEGAATAQFWNDHPEYRRLTSGPRRGRSRRVSLPRSRRERTSSGRSRRTPSGS
jgi:hypothetical protein